MRAAGSLMFTREYDRAIEQFSQAIDLDPENPLHYVNRGNARQTNYLLKEAVEDFDHAIGLDPSSSLAFLGRGETYVKMGEYDHAIDDFGEAIKLFRGNAAPTSSAVPSTSRSAIMAELLRISTSPSNWIRFVRSDSAREA